MPSGFSPNPNYPARPRPMRQPMMPPQGQTIGGPGPRPPGVFGTPNATSVETPNFSGAPNPGATDLAAALQASRAQGGGDRGAMMQQNGYGGGMGGGVMPPMQNDYTAGTMSQTGGPVAPGNGLGLDPQQSPTFNPREAFQGMPGPAYTPGIGGGASQAPGQGMAKPLIRPDRGMTDRPRMGLGLGSMKPKPQKQSQPGYPSPPIIAPASPY